MASVKDNKTTESNSLLASDRMNILKKEIEELDGKLMSTSSINLLELRSNTEADED
jgi:hypothetical protein